MEISGDSYIFACHISPISDNISFEGNMEIRGNTYIIFCMLHKSISNNIILQLLRLWANYRSFLIYVRHAYTYSKIKSYHFHITKCLTCIIIYLAFIACIAIHISHVSHSYHTSYHAQYILKFTCDTFHNSYIIK